MSTVRATGLVWDAQSGRPVAVPGVLIPADARDLVFENDSDRQAWADAHPELASEATQDGSDASEDTEPAPLSAKVSKVRTRRRQTGEVR